MEKQGIISRASPKGDKYGFQLEDSDIWYNGFNECPGKKGDTIKFTYEENESNGKVYYNVKSVESVEKGEVQPTQKDTREINTDVMCAKDIFVALITADKDLDVSTDGVMKESIDLVKQARKAFNVSEETL